MLGWSARFLSAIVAAAFVFQASAANAKGESHEILAAIERLEKLEPGLQGEPASEAMDLISQIAKYPFSESADALVARIKTETRAMLVRYHRLPSKVINDYQSNLKPGILLHAISKLADFATIKYFRIVVDVLAPLNEIAENSQPFDEHLGKALKRLKEGVNGVLDVPPHRVASMKPQQRQKPLPSIMEELAARGGPHPGLPSPLRLGLKKSAAADRIAGHYREIKEFLKARVIGQDEAIDALADLEVNNMMFKSREEPPRIMFMGQPGTGKDTLAQAYTDFINGYEGAWKDNDHLFKVPVLRTEADLWKLMGSATGYIGSNEPPALLKFLVRHSGGKYTLEKKEEPGGRTSFFVRKNAADAQDGQMSYSPPEKGVVFLNEFHNWPQAMKDTMKVAIEKGEWELNAPGDGEALITVPVTFIIATNEGTSLLTSVDENGERFGEPLTAEQMQHKWDQVKNDRQRLVDVLTQSNRRYIDNMQLGYSPEMLNRLEGWPIVLMRPHGQDELLSITEINLDLLNQRFKSNSTFPNLEVVWTEGLVNFLQSHNYRAEAMARPIKGKVKDMVLATIQDAIIQSKIPMDLRDAKLEMTPVKNEDRTHDMEFKVIDASNGRVVESFRLPIRATAGDKIREAMPAERIAYLSKLGQFLSERVFGLNSALIQGVERSTLLAEEAKYGKDDTESATVLGFFGKSSTGKTQTIKIINEYLTGSKKPYIIDFSQVRTVQDLKNKILGSRDHNNRPIESDFMRFYDREDGKLIIAFDEIANAPLDALKALYDILREPVVSTFSDGKPRAMKGVTLILTGNAGEEIYRGIPKDEPEWIQMYAMKSIYEQFSADPGARRVVLEKYFSEAFINRIGEMNIFFFAPISFKSLRELTQLKLMEMVESLKPAEGRHGWNIVFESKKTFLDIVEMVEQDGFVLAEQGASLDRFISKYLQKELKTTLMLQKVPVGSTVVLRRNKDAERTVREGSHEIHELRVSAITASGQEFDIVLKGRPVEKTLPQRDEDRFLTAIHEAGHAVAAEVLLTGIQKNTLISVIPGVTQINEEWVSYAGVAEHKKIRGGELTKERIMAEMAVLAAGESAQRLATKGKRHDAGKHNDMERATALALKGILHFGLSESWGTMSVPAGMDTKEFIAGLSAERRKILFDEVDSWVKQARQIAEYVLAANFEGAVLPMANTLAEKGRVEGHEMEKLIASLSFSHLQNGKVKMTANAQKWLTGQPGAKSVDAELVDWIKMPAKIAKHEDIIAADRKAELEKVELPKGLPLKARGESALGSMLKSKANAGDCGGLLK
jgi:ATP-dependent Clp protease ATP-binding subunit ClpA